MQENPYASPTADDAIDPAAIEGDQLAGRFTRFAAAFADGLLLMLITMPVMFATGYFARAQAQQVGFIEQVAMALFGMMVMLVLNGYLLITRGQSIGKVLTKIQIVDVRTEKLLPFQRVYVYRYLWVLPIVVIVAFIPGTADDLLVNGVSLVDSVMIFGAARRCLHDYIAGSKVVMYQPNRQRVS